MMNFEKSVCRIAVVKNENLKSIFEIENKSYEFPWSLQSIIDQLNNPNAFNRLIFIEPDPCNLHTLKIVGYIFGYYVLRDLFITNICIHPDYKKNKLASLLLENLFVEATRVNIKSVFLEVRKSNIAAISLYKKFNFIHDGERKN